MEDGGLSAGGLWGRAEGAAIVWVYGVVSVFSVCLGLEGLLGRGRPSRQDQRPARVMREEGL